ncbi:MAG: hypothetical protein ACOC5F_04495 [Candidatus Aminicenantaceae bacterium]
MNRFKSFSFIFIIFVLFFSQFVFSSSKERKIIPFEIDVFSGEKKGHISGKVCILITDYDYLNCSLCRNSLFRFIEKANENKAENILGVVVCSKDLIDSEQNRKVAQKRIKGFCIGIDVKFPMILDEDHIFSSYKGKEPRLIVLDTIQKEINEFLLSEIPFHKIF